MQKKIFIISSLFFSALLFSGCNGCKGEDPNAENAVDSTEMQNETVGKIIKFNGRLFSIPSPIQIAELIKNTNATYNQDAVNPTSNVSKYTSSDKQALNLGVYGADLGYINIYEQYSDAAKYFNVVKNLSHSLNIMNSFTEKVFADIEKYGTNKDSLTKISARAYRNADSYLIDNERNDVAVLVIAGGWVESLYLLTENYKERKNQDILLRIGDQKHPLDNLIELLKPYYGHKSGDYDLLVEQLAEMAMVFDGVDIKYTFVEPIVYPDKKLTVIKSKTDVIINEYQLKAISEQILKIRKQIID
jgi:hypothetical protein